MVTLRGCDDARLMESIYPIVQIRESLNCMHTENLCPRYTYMRLSN